MKTDPPKPRMAPQGVLRGASPTRGDMRVVPAHAPVDRASGAGAPPAKIRLVIATFLTNDALLDAIGELEKAGFGAGQVGIAGLDKSIGALAAIAAQQSETLLGELLSVVAQADPALMFTGDDFVLVACGPLWQEIGRLADSAEDGGKLVIGTWMDPATRTDLTRQISAGAVVLSVHSDTVDQQRSSARILLNHSSHRVQMHEFTAN